MNWIKQIFDLFSRRTASREPAYKSWTELAGPNADQELLKRLDGIDQRWHEDFLGDAAVAGSKAQQAIREQRYDDAWRLLNEQKLLYLQHAQRSGFTKMQTLAIDGSTHEHLANILRLENKHDDAFIHLLYSVVTDSRPSKSKRQKVVAYFNRCKFKNLALKDVEKFMADMTHSPDFQHIQKAVKEWRDQS